MQPTGLKEAQAVVTSALEKLIRGEYKPGGRLGTRLSGSSSGTAEGGALASSRRRLQAESSVPNPVDAPISLEVCDWLNITACNATGAPSSVAWT